MASPGPKARRGEVADRILHVARESFARDGYAATTMQGIARDVGVDTKLVRYYYSSKEALLESCLVVPAELLAGLHGVRDLPPDVRGEAIVRVQLATWTVPDLALVLRTCLLIAAHEPIAMERVRAIFVDGLIPALGLDPDAPDTRLRGGLISTQLLGLGFARFIYDIDQVVTIPDHIVIREVGATIQRYLDADGLGELGKAGTPTATAL